MKAVLLSWNGLIFSRELREVIIISSSKFGIFSYLGTIGDHIPENYRLLEFLTNKSDLTKEILPAPDINKPVNVEVRIKLRQIADVVS